MKSFLELYNAAITSGLVGDAAAAQARTDYEQQAAAAALAAEESAAEAARVAQIEAEASAKALADAKGATQASDDAERIAFETRMCFAPTDDPAEIEVRRAAWNDPDQREARAEA